MRDMKCTRCGEEMEGGYIFVKGYADSLLYWSKIKEQSYWRNPKEVVEILKYGIWQQDKKYWMRQAYRCEKCGLITFEEKYTLPNEEKVEKK